MVYTKWLVKMMVKLQGMHSLIALLDMAASHMVVAELMKSSVNMEANHMVAI